MPQSHRKLSVIDYGINTFTCTRYCGFGVGVSVILIALSSAIAKRRQVSRMRFRFCLWGLTTALGVALPFVLPFVVELPDDQYKEFTFYLCLIMGYPAVPGLAALVTLLLIMARFGFPKLPPPLPKWSKSTIEASERALQVPRDRMNSRFSKYCQAST